MNSTIPFSPHLFFGIFFLSLILVVIIIRFILRAYRKKLEPLAQEIGGEVNASAFGGIYLRFQYQDAEAKVEIRTGGQNSPPRLILKLMKSPGFKLSITKENPLTHVLERMGLSEIKLGVPEFDQKYYIYSKDKTQTMNLLSDPRKRALIDELFENGFDELQIDTEKIYCTRIGYQDYLNANYILPNIKRLYELAV